MADSAAPTTSPATRTGSTKRRASIISTDTENKLARAARSAQRLAQLTEPPRDDSNLDLFPDDTERATQQALNVDIRQGTLSGFELPGELLVAASAATAAEASSMAAAEVRAARRAARAAKVDRGAAALAEAEGVTAGAVAVREGDATGASDGVVASSDATGSGDGAVASKDTQASALPVSVPVQGIAASAPTSASAALMRDIVAIQDAQAADAEAMPGTTAAAARFGARDPSQRSATTFSNAGSASATREVTAQSGSLRDQSAASDAADEPEAAPAPSAAPAVTETRTSATASAASTSTRIAPELDHARATAFADTVDALYGVIADQRRAAGEHSRRMKWLLSIVVCALLVTVAIGIAQTVLLMRLTHDTTLQQQRIEQMILNQQATLSTLLDTDTATVSAPVFSAAPASTQAPVAPRASTQAAQATQGSGTAGKHAARQHHAHKPKPTQTPAQSSR